MKEGFIPQNTFQQDLHRGALRNARDTLRFHRNTLVVVAISLLSEPTPQARRIRYAQYETVVTAIDQIVKQEVIPAKTALGLPIEDEIIENISVSMAREHALATGLSPDVAEFVVRGSMERTKINQGKYKGEEYYYEAPEESAA